MPTLPKVSPELIQKYQEEISKNSSEATAKRKAASLNKFFGWAEAEGHIDANPMPAPPSSEYTAINPKSKKNIGLRTWAILGTTTGIIILIFLLTWKLKFPIQFIANQAASINNMAAVPSPTPGNVISANPTGNMRWNLYANLKLMDSAGSPQVGSQTITFNVYDAQSGGSPLYTEGPQTVTTDSNGSVLISLDKVPSDLFFQNRELFLEPVVGSVAASVRIPISTANIAANLGGYFPANPDTGAGALTIPVIDGNGSLNLASASPTINALAGNLLIQGQAVTIKSVDGGNGNITINPDGSGIANFLFEGSSGNFLSASAPNLNSGSLYYGVVANNATHYYLLKLQSGSSPITRFSVDALGNASASGNLNVTNTISDNGYTQSSGNFTINQKPGDFASIIKKGTALSNVLNLTLDENGITGSNYASLVLSRLGGDDNSRALLVKNGNAEFNGQVELGRFDTNPSAMGTGSLIYNATDNKVYVWDGSSWTDLAGSGAANLWQLNLGVISPLDITNDLAIGGTSTASAKFQIFGDTGIARGPIQDKGGQNYDVKAYGAVGDGATDDTAAVQAAITAADAANGGIIYFPSGTYLISSALSIPNDGRYTPFPRQKSFRFTGAGSSSDFGNAVRGGATLDLRDTTGVAKFDTRGNGYLEIDHLTIQDNGSDAVPFIQTTNTTLNIHDNYFYGTKSGTSADQDAIVLGGTSTTVDGGPNAPFQGYGTTIENNTFNQVRRGVYLRTYANGVVIKGNSWTGNSGSNLADGAALESDGGGDLNHGNYIIGNTFEMNSYPYGIKMANSASNNIEGNGFYDPTATTLAYVRFESTASRNFVIEGTGTAGYTMLSDANGTNNRLTSLSGQTNYLSQNLAIGTGTPTEMVTINGGAAASTLGLHGNVNTNANFYMTENGNTTGTLLQYDGNYNEFRLIAGTTLTSAYTRMVVARDTGNVGIGSSYTTAAPASKFEVSGAATGKALVMFNELGDQDVFTASVSSTPRFRITNGGDVIIGPSGTFDHPSANEDAYIKGNLEVDGIIYGATVNPGFTTGSVVFAGASGELAQDNANFFWDNTNKRLGIGTAAPAPLGGFAATSTLQIGGSSSLKAGLVLGGGGAGTDSSRIQFNIGSGSGIAHYQIFSDGTFAGSMTATTNGTFNFYNNGDSATSKFSIATTGNLTTPGNLAVNGGTINSTGALTINSATGANALTLDSGSTGNVDIGTNANAKNITIGNATGATSVILTKGASGYITLTGFNCTSPGYTNNGKLTADASGHIVCADDIGGSGSSVNWNDLLDPTNDLTLSMGAHTTTMNWIAPASLDAWTMNLTNNDATAATQNFVTINNAVTTQAGNTEALLVLNNADTDTAGSSIVDNAILITNSGGIASGVTDAIDASASDIVNAINVGPNVILGTTATIDFTNFDVDSSGNITVANQGDIRLSEGTGGGTNYTGFQAPATLASDNLYTLPNAFPGSATGYFLTSDTSGVMSWSNSISISSLKWNALTDPDGNLTLAMADKTTTWNWNSLTTDTGLTASSNSLSSGTLASFSVSSTAAVSATQKVLALSMTGVNANNAQTTYGLYATNTHSGTTSTNVAGYFSASGGTSNNYAAIFDQGNVGIGTTTPSYKLDIATSTASDRGINIANTAATGTNYGVYSSVTGAATTNYGGYFVSTGAGTSNFGLAVAALTGATSTGLDIGAMTGTTANKGINIGNITAAATANNFAINTGTITPQASATTYGINIGNTLAGAGTATYGINIGTNASTATDNYGMKIGAISGAGTTNTGLYVDTVSNATNNYAAIFAGGNVGIGTTSPTNILSLGGNSARTFWMERNTLADTAGNSLTLQSGGATSGATDKNAGALILKSGTSTGAGTGQIQFWTSPATGGILTISATPTTGGTGYTASDTLTVTTGGTSGTVTVATVDGSGVVLTMNTSPVTAGSGYSTGIGMSTTGGTGSGCTVNITAITGTADNTLAQRMTILGNGNVGIGVTTPAKPLDIAYSNAVSKTSGPGIFQSLYTQTVAGPSATTYGWYNKSDYTAASGTLYETGAAKYDSYNDSTGTISRMFALDSNLNNYTTGTVTLGAAVHARIYQQATGGTITAGHTFLVENAYKGGGTLTGLTGLTVNNMTSGTNNTNLLLGTQGIPTGNFSIYNASAYDNYFAGKVGIGDTTPDHTLDVAGNIGLDAGGYINWGDTDGSGGYGFWDNGGILEWKNSGGTWAAFGSGSSNWTLNTTDGTLYPINSTVDVLIGATSTASAKFAFTNVNTGTPVFQTTGVIHTGGVSATTTLAYNQLGPTATTHTLTSTSDLVISGIEELDGVLYLNGRNISSYNGITTVLFPSDPTAIDSYNLLTNGSWLIQNPAAGNPGIAALMVDQRKGGDIFTASQSGTTKFTISNAGNVTIRPGTPGAGNGTMLTVGDGTGKIDAGTYDPVYNINGTKYATYLSGMTGVKEETTGNLQTLEYIAGIGYRQVLDFKDLAVGSDLWLFSQATDIKDSIGQMVVLLSGSSNARTWYQIDKNNYTLSIYSDRPTVVSYRLSAPRFDAASWGNYNDNPNSVGFEIHSSDIIGTGDTQTPSSLSFADFEIVKNIESNAYKLYQNITDGGRIAIEEFGSFANLVAGNIKAGTIAALNTQTKLISPLPDGTDVTVQIGSTATPSGKFAIQNSTGVEVASIDNRGNATFSGNVHSQNIDEIQKLLSQVTADQSVLLSATAGANLNATGSANISELITNDLYVTGQAAINSLSVTSSITLGSDLVIGQDGNTINSLSAPLKLQSLAMAPVEIMAGLVTIDTHGNVQIAGDLVVAGKIKSSGLTIQDASGTQVAQVDATGSASFRNLTTDGLAIASDSLASNSAVINGVIETNATAGKAVIPAGISEITIKNPKVSDYTLIYITPTSSTLNNVLYIKGKEAGQFIVGFTDPISTDVSFNWWIIEAK